MRITLDTEVKTVLLQVYIAYVHDVMAAILVFQNNEMVALLAYQTKPVVVDLFSYVNFFKPSIKAI